MFSLFDETDNLHVGIEDLAIEEDAFYRGREERTKKLTFSVKSAT